MSRRLNDEEPRRQMLVSYSDARIISTALRLAVSGAVDPVDVQYLASHLGEVSMLWADTSALRAALYEQNMRNGTEQYIAGAAS